MKNIIIGFFIVLAFVIGYFFAKFTNDMNTEIVTLKKPLKIQCNNEEGVLPTGTILFFEKGMSEGFDVYKVYLNISQPLKKEKSRKKWFRAPLWVVEE